VGQEREPGKEVAAAETQEVIPPLGQRMQPALCPSTRGTWQLGGDNSQQNASQRTPYTHSKSNDIGTAKAVTRSLLLSTAGGREPCQARETERHCPGSAGKKHQEK